MELIDRNLSLKQLSINDVDLSYDMMQRIGKNENEFTNTANGLSKAEFSRWLIQQDDWSKSKNLPEGYVSQTIFWFMSDDIAVGIGKIRHELNSHSREIGGNLGYAIDPNYRGMGYASEFLKLLLEKTKEMQIKDILLTVEAYNPASKKVIEKAGGNLIKETKERWYFSF